MLKKAFSLIELMVVIAIIALLSAMVYTGLGKSRADEGLKADYLEFYEDAKSLQVRANLGKLNSSLPGNTAVQTLSFTLGDTGYTINGQTKDFKNNSLIEWVKSSGSTSYSTGGMVFTVYFYPSNFSGLTPTGGPSGTEGQYICHDSLIKCIGGFNLSDVKIYISAESGSGFGYPVQLSGTNFKIEVINKRNLEAL